MAEKTTLKRRIISFPGELDGAILAFAKERGQTFSGAVREITRVRITREKRTKKEYAQAKNIPGRHSVGRGK